MFGACVCTYEYALIYKPVSVVEPPETALLFLCLTHAAHFWFLSMQTIHMAADTISQLTPNPTLSGIQSMIEHSTQRARVP